MLYLIANGAQQTTAAFVKVTTNNVIKTLLQVKPVIPIEIVEWGISFDGSAAATPGAVELIETGTVFATVTASAEADITKQDGTALLFGNTSAVIFTLGTSATGYTASAEGSIVACRNFDLQLIAPTNQYVKQFPLGARPIIQGASSARIRVTFGTAVNAYCYMILNSL